MLELLSGQSFFALSSEHRRVLLDEIYYLVRHSNFSYSDLINMPTYERKYFFDLLVREFDKRNEQANSRKNKR